MEAQLFPPGRGKVHVVVIHKYEGLCDAPNLPNTLQVSGCNIITFLKWCKIPSRGGCRCLFYYIPNMRILSLRMWTNLLFHRPRQKVCIVLKFGMNFSQVACNKNDTRVWSRFDSCPGSLDYCTSDHYK